MMKKIVCIGAGRLANQLMPALEEDGDCEVVQVYNRTAVPAELLSKKLHKASFTSVISEIDKDADIYFLAISDDAIPFVADQLMSIVPIDSIGVHCSGSLELDVLPFERKAGFYPLQSFSLNHEVSWRWIPLIITAPDEDTWLALDEIAGRLSSSVYRMTDEQKSVLHVAAVFANNFSNHMLTLAESICAEQNLPFEILKPLILETFSKAIVSGPRESQTGPAVRGDQKTIEKHLRILAGHEELTAIYKVITRSIVENK